MSSIFLSEKISKLTKKIKIHKNIKINKKISKLTKNIKLTKHIKINKKYKFLKNKIPYTTKCYNFINFDEFLNKIS